MSTEYTPTTDEMRAVVTAHATNPKREAALGAAFDRWLAGEIRKAKDEAWEAGYEEGAYWNGGTTTPAPNPYEATS